MILRWVGERCHLRQLTFAKLRSPAPVTRFTDSGAQMRTLADSGFVSLRPDEGKTAGLQACVSEIEGPGIFDKLGE